VRLELVDRRRRHEHVDVTGSSLHALAKLLQKLVTTRVWLATTRSMNPDLLGCNPAHVLL
jgi:hypothetical protein